MTQVRGTIAAADIPDLLASVHGALLAARDEVNALNVFPVPDGDTGTNMVSTVASAMEAVAGLAEDASGDQFAAASARGALRGAAGNSGVIFSQVVRVFAEHLAEGDIDADGFAHVLSTARDLSYDAVAEPVAGTILTVMDAAADAAGVAAGSAASLADVIVATLDAVEGAVAATRDVLPANRAAGVVDAGARGFEVALCGMLGFVRGEPVAAPPPPVRRTGSQRTVTRESGSLEYAHEVQYLLTAPDDVAAGLRSRLTELGDSVVVVAGGGLLNVHVHTNDVDDAIAAGRALGDLDRVHVTAFADDEVDDVDAGEGDGGRAAFGYLAVVPGPGLRRLVEDLGAVAVDGAAGRLPTVADLIDAVRRVAADTVVVLPGHRNVVPTAQQAATLVAEAAGRSGHVVVEADSVPAVLSVLACAGTDAMDPAELADLAREVRAGEVVTAVRDATTPIGHVIAGQFLAVVAGDVVAATLDPLDALSAVLDHLDAPAAEIITLISGLDTSHAERQAARRLLGEVAGGVEVEVVVGDQRPVRWIVGVE